MFIILILKLQWFFYKDKIIQFTKKSLFANMAIFYEFCVIYYSFVGNSYCGVFFI